MDVTGSGLCSVVGFGVRNSGAQRLDSKIHLKWETRS